jgi:hypothetical protein
MGKHRAARSRSCWKLSILDHPLRFLAAPGADRQVSIIDEPLQAETRGESAATGRYASNSLRRYPFKLATVVRNFISRSFSFRKLPTS